MNSEAIWQDLQLKIPTSRHRASQVALRAIVQFMNSKPLGYGTDALYANSEDGLPVLRHELRGAYAEAVQVYGGTLEEIPDADCLALIVAACAAQYQVCLRAHHHMQN